MNCNHENIYWDDFFKKEKIKNAYCLDCGDDKSDKFSVAFQRWYYKKIEKWLKDNTSVIGSEFDNFLKKKNYYDVYSDLQRGRLGSMISDFMNQELYWEMAGYIEKYCQEFKKEKEQKKPNNPKREREREISQLKKKIKKLEKKSNRTPEEEAELENLRNKLRELENHTEKQPVNYLPWIIGGSVLVLGVIIVVLLFRKSKRKSYY